MLKNLPAWDETSVKSMKVALEQTHKGGKTVHFATLMDVCQLTNFGRGWLAVMRFGRSFCAGGVRSGRRPISLESGSTTLVSQRIQRSTIRCVGANKESN